MKYLYLILGVTSIAAVLALVVLRPTETVAVSCDDAENKPLCFTNELERVLEADGVASALDTLALFYESDPAFKQYCHGNTHEIGYRAYEIYRETGRVEITPKASYCGFGYYHGFIEKMISVTGSIAESREFCTKVGKEMEGMQAYAEGSCYHGIGHGVTDGTDPTKWGDPHAIIETGMDMCRNVSTTDDSLMRCSSGVFNSLALFYREEKYKLGRPQDPYALCEAVQFSAPEKKSCYSQMNTLVAYLSEHDPQKSLAYAMVIKDPVQRANAIENIASLPVQWKGRDYDEIASICLSSAGDEASGCVRGVAAGMMEFGTPGREADRSLMMCAASQLTREQRNHCYNGILSMTQGMFPHERVLEMCRIVRKDAEPSLCDPYLSDL